MVNQKRIHGIDSLRAIAMLLGIVLHASIAYKAKPHRNWIYDESFHSWAFSFIYFCIHSFRMPLFFVVAGFFCRLLYLKVGERAFIKHRWKRVGIPFIGAMVLIVPFSLIPYKVYFLTWKMKVPLETAVQSACKEIVSFNGLAHLWFLYDLLLFYVVVVLLMRLYKYGFLRHTMTHINHYWMKVKLSNPLLLLLPVILLWLCMLPDNELFPITDTYVIPRRFTNLVYYGMLFFAGWLLHKRQDMFGAMIHHQAKLLVGGAVACVLTFYLEYREVVDHGTPGWYLLKLLAALEVVLVVTGSIGFFLKFFKNESRFWLYVSDASYWVYLVHLLVVTTMQFLLLDSAVPGLLRFPLVLLVTLVLTFISYHWFVRYTFIGTLLHGPRKKHPETRPAYS